MYKKYIEGKKAVCFDLDGTLVDSNPLHAAAFEKVLGKNFPDLNLATAYGLIGESLTEKWKRIVDARRAHKEHSVTDLIQQTREEFTKIIDKTTLVPRPGFWDIAFFLKEEKGLPLTMATNTEKETAEKIMKKAGLEGVFDFIIFGEEVKNPKPNPEIYNRVAQTLKIKPEEMLVFEDSLPGAQAADKAGSALIVVWDGNTMQNLFPERTLVFLPDFEGLSQYLNYTADEMLEYFTKLKDEEQPQQTQTQPR